ncbi:MAG: hypothetical protein P8J68_06705 [Arenicellaceae bacterium]|nr:hypothetical protein [Arenicellaceae bacterium]
MMRVFWDICVYRDIEAFISQDWSITAPDFDESRFLGIHAHNSNNPADWTPQFTTLESYQKSFSKQAREFAKLTFAPRYDAHSALYKSLKLESANIQGDIALLTKVFDGDLILATGEVEAMAWRSLFQFRNSNGRWLITGFVGYLPL